MAQGLTMFEEFGVPRRSRAPARIGPGRLDSRVFGDERLAAEGTPLEADVGHAPPCALTLVGICHRTSSLPLRDGMSVSGDDALRLLGRAVTSGPAGEAFVLSTCNRTEFYLVTDEPPRDSSEAWLNWLGGWRSDEVMAAFESQAFRRYGADAANHLFRVACGLESAVLGDVQIQAQVKEAIRIAQAAGSLGPVLRRVASQALQLARRARAETSISLGAPTIGSALARLLDDRMRDETRTTRARVLVLGAGDAAQTIGRHLAKRAFTDLTFVNRTMANASAVARECGGTAIPWAQMIAELERTDVVVAATSAPTPLLTADLLTDVADRRTAPLLVVDASVPRNVESSDAVEIVDIDAIRDRQVRDLDVRRSAVPAVEHLIADEARRWEQWAARQPIEGLIRSLYLEAEALSRRDAEWVRGAAVLTPEDAQRALYASFKHLLHDHVRKLRELAS